MQLQETTYYSPKEYLALEAAAEFRHEYRDGQIVPRSASTVSHNQIVGNIVIHLDRNLPETASAFAVDLRLWVPKTRMHTYPDVVTIVGGLQMLDSCKDTVTNPSLIIEVLSESTKDYDRGEKFRAYRSIPSFAEYLLVDQYSIHVEHFAKNAQGQWVLTDYDDRTDVIALTSIDCELPLTTIYSKITV